MSFKKVFEGFQNFILRGNSIDLAVGVVIGASFNSIISSLVRDLLTPFISAIFFLPNFSGLSFLINKNNIVYGDFLNSLISFLLVAIAVYFIVIVPMNIIKKPKIKNTKNCPECQSEIPLNAKRCAFCAQII